jgi:hypothetical protein
VSKLQKTLRIVAAIVALESLALYVATATFIYGIIAGDSRSLPAMLALTALIALAAIWLTYCVLALLQGKRWARSSAIFWQTCQLAIASASFSGVGANAFIGVALIVPSLAVIALLFTKPVIDAAKEELG